MRIKSNVRINRVKQKLIIEDINYREFKTGEWLKYVPNSNMIELSYNSRNNVLIIIDTPVIESNNVRLLK